MRMDYYKKYQEIIADYNREKDRATVEETFAQLVDLAASLDAEQKPCRGGRPERRRTRPFDMLFKDNISKADRERLKAGQQALLASLRGSQSPWRLDSEGGDAGRSPGLHPG